MMKKLALYGSGDLGSGIIELYQACQKADPIYGGVVFVDDDPDARSPEDGVQVIAFDELVELAAVEQIEAIVCIGEPATRKEVFERLDKVGIGFGTLVHPAAVVSAKTTIGRGCVVGSGSHIGPATVVGDNTIIMGASVSHNCDIGSHCVLVSNATLSCHVKIGGQTFVSIGAMVREGVSVGSRVILGMGAAVFLDVEDDLYMIGNPARQMRRNEDQRVFRS